MFSFSNINTIARFESKILFRSWFFRVLTILSLVILGFFDFAMVSKQTGMNWTFVAVSSFMPYMVLMLFNLVQAIIAVFLASDFARRDKNLDTSKVIFTRPVSNTEYFLGKTLGILYVFLIINALVLVEALIFNLTSKLVNLDIISYLIYPLFISLPTLLFIIGLSYIFMTITGNQAITFILLIGYVALTSFFLGDKLNYMLDFMAYRVPLAQSDFIGFGNIGDILIHRGMYTLYGIGLIFLSIRFMNRLPQSKNTNAILVISLIFLFAGALLSVKYISAISASDKFRANIIETNNKYVDYPLVDIGEYQLNIIHNKQIIEATAQLNFINNSGQDIRELIFSLNNGFVISKISYNNNDIKFVRELHLISIKPGEALKPKEKGLLTISYKGAPDDRSCYLDIDTTTWREQFRMFLINVDNRFGIITDDYLHLTRETNWYPVAGAGYSPKHRFNTNKDFADYKIEVTTKPNLTAISQGELTESGNGHFVYKTDVAIPQVSLTIGEYEKLSIDIDSVEYALYRKKGHNYWTQHFTELGDTVDDVIKELIDDYERKLGLKYPYSKCLLVEVPIQFSALPRFNTVSWDFSQPEILLIPENGFMLFNADFRQMEMSRRFRERNEELTEKEKQISMLKRGFNASFASGTAFIRSKVREGEISNYFSLFPLYYTYVYDIKSDKWPIMNLALESYFNARIKGQMENFMRRMGGLSSEEKANLYLQKNTLKYYLENERNRDKLNSIINVKGDYLFTVIKYKTGVKEFNNILDGFLDKHKFSQVDFNDFLGILNENYEWDINSILDNWYASEKSPTYAFDLGEYYKVLKDNKEVNQIIFRITNHSEIEGFFNVTFEEDRGERRGFGMMEGYGSDSNEEYIFNLQPGETKEIGLQPDKQTRSYYVNTIVSNNIPPTFQRWTQHYELKENAVEFEGERVIENKVEFVYPNEIVVDNEDNGFKLTEPGSNKILKKLFESGKDDEFEYVNFNWEPQPKWQLFANTEVYGRTIHSAYYTKPGKGDFKATWTAKLPESGKYDVYTYVVGAFVNRGHGRGRNRNRDGAYGSFIYVINHDDGSEEVPLVLKDVEHGWNYLGEFYFSGDSATIELSNKGEPPMIITADAMKWVKK